MLINMLNLPNFKIPDMKESEYDYRFLVESTALSPSHCPKCGTVANLYKHDKKQQLFFDLTMNEKRVGIYVNRQRYKCRDCNETFFENLTDMDTNSFVTNRLINWIQEASLEKTFTSVADDIGVDEKTVETSLMTTSLNLKHKQISELPNRLVLMKSIYSRRVFGLSCGKLVFKV